MYKYKSRKVESFQKYTQFYGELMNEWKGWDEKGFISFLDIKTSAEIIKI